MIASPSPGFGGTAEIPGDKSISHRALIFSAMAEGTSRISGLLEAEDVAATRKAIEMFGVEVGQEDGSLLVTGRKWRQPSGAIDCGNSGTSARLLMGAAAGVPGIASTFIGDVSLSKRPMKRIIDPLSRMGARIEGGPTLPITVHGEELGGIDFESPVASAQVKSAILLAGLSTDAPVRVVEPHASRDHSEVMLAAFGVDGAVEEVEGGLAVSLGPSRKLVATDIPVPADPSSAAFAWAAAAIIEGAQVTTPGVCVNATRTGFLEALETMGAEIVLSNQHQAGGEPVADVTVRQRPLQPIRWSANKVPATIDEIPLLAIVAAFADGESSLEGLAELKVKESDRLGAVAAGLAANGASVFPEADGLRILGRGSVPGGGKVTVHHDHRIAMGFLVMGLGAANPVAVDDVRPIATSFPTFAPMMQSLGALLEDAS